MESSMAKTVTAKAAAKKTTAKAATADEARKAPAKRAGKAPLTTAAPKRAATSAAPKPAAQQPAATAARKAAATPAKKAATRPVAKPAVKAGKAAAPRTVVQEKPSLNKPAATPAPARAKAGARKSATAAAKKSVKAGAKKAAAVAKKAPVRAAAAAMPASLDKPRLVRDSFTMPEGEYAVLAQVKQACLKAGFAVKKSELLRIGVALISQIDLATLQLNGWPPCQCICASVSSFSSRIGMFDFSCMRSRMVAPTFNLRWRILLMIGGCTSSTRHSSASFFRFMRSISVSSSLLGTKLDGSSARARCIASSISCFFCRTLTFFSKVLNRWLGQIVSFGRRRSAGYCCAREGE
jgi:hypothetical protein